MDARPSTPDTPPCYLAFDLGASSGRAVLGTLRGDTMQMEELHRFETPVAEAEGHLFWDVDALWAELRAGLRLALERAPQLRSLSVDAWGVDYVPLGADGRPLRRPYCYRDPRTEGVMARAFETLPADRIYALTGIQFLPFNTLYQLLAEHPPGEEAGRVERYLPIADYFNYRFSGRAVVEVSMASTTQLLDVHTRAWCGPLFRQFGLREDAWPAVVPSGTPLGPVREAPGVTVVATCSHDTGSAVAAAPARTENPWAFVSAGTWSLLGAERRSPLLTDAARTAGFTNEAGLDGTVRFLKNLTGLWALQECARGWGGVAWRRLEEEARAAPRLATRIDLEDPRFLARGDMEARLLAWCREHHQAVPGTRGALARVVLESVAESYRRALADLSRITGDRYATLHLFGGGAQNTLLCQLTADACGVPVVAGPVEATALGNLLIQARALGDLPAGLTVREAAARSSGLRVYHPGARPVAAPHPDLS